MPELVIFDSRVDKNMMLSCVQVEHSQTENAQPKGTKTLRLPSSARKP